MSDKLKVIVHQAISDCCARDLLGARWLATPQELENRLLKVLNLQDFADQQLDKARTLTELENLSHRFKVLLDYTEKQKEVKLTDVELDVARVKAKIEVLTWAQEETGFTIAAAIEELQKQLEALEKVLV